MKMPHGVLSPHMLAPCGMNCMVCYKHCDSPKPCAGCLNSDAGKPEHCRKCAIKDCVREKGHTYCYECGEYPCKRLKSLEKSYQTRYHASLMENSKMARELGLTAFMARQKERYTCPNCGGVISLHEGVCTECGTRG